MFSPMKNDEVKQWLKSCGKNGVWLAAQLGRTTASIYKWLNVPGADVPRAHEKLISLLMEKEAAARVDREKHEVCCGFTEEEFSRLSAHAAVQGMTVEEWALHLLRGLRFFPRDGRDSE